MNGCPSPPRYQSPCSSCSAVYSFKTLLGRFEETGDMLYCKHRLAIPMFLDRFGNATGVLRRGGRRRAAPTAFWRARFRPKRLPVAWSGLPMAIRLPCLMQIASSKRFVSPVSMPRKKLSRSVTAETKPF